MIAPAGCDAYGEIDDSDIGDVVVVHGRLKRARAVASDSEVAFPRPVCMSMTLYKYHETVGIGTKV